MLLDLESGEYYELQGTAPFVWSLLDGETSVDEAADRVADAYGVAPELAASDVRNFVRELAERHLLVAAPRIADQATDPEIVAPTIEYAAPIIESRGNLKFLGQLD